MDRDHVVDRRVRRDDDLLGLDHVAVARLDAGHRAALDLARVCAVEELPAVATDRARQSVEILQRMKLPLPRVTEASAGVEAAERRAVDPMRIVQSDTMRGVELLLKPFVIFTVR